MDNSMSALEMLDRAAVDAVIGRVVAHAALEVLETMFFISAEEQRERRAPPFEAGDISRRSPFCASSL
ncbi:MAG: hypothetical protein ABI165_03060, partial [Bryobacteraceae bacterium]